METNRLGEYRLDLSGKSLENKITREQLKRSKHGDGSLIVPRHTPFYLESVILYLPNSTIPLELNVDYEFVDIDHDLTQLAGAPLSWFIKLKKPELTNPQVSYQTLGTVPKLTETTKAWFKAAAEDDRPVWWDYINNKPRWFTPRLHGHDLNTAFYNFSKLKELYERKRETLFGENSPIPHREFYLGQIENLNSYLTVMYDYLDNQLTRHINSNSHFTKSSQIPGLELIDNVRTATVKQTLEGEDERLRVVARAAHLKLKEGLVNTNDYSSVVNPEPLTVLTSIKDIPSYSETLSIGVKELNIAPFIHRNQKGYGIGEFYDQEGRGLYWLLNLNPYGLDKSVHLNQWKNTHVPLYFNYKGELIYPDKLLPGSNGKHCVVGDTFTGEWFYINFNKSNDHSEFTVHLIPNAEDIQSRHDEFRVVTLGNKFGIYRFKNNFNVVQLELYLVDPVDLIDDQLPLHRNEIIVKGLTGSFEQTFVNTINLYQEVKSGNQLTRSIVEYTSPVFTVNDDRHPVLLGDENTLTMFFPESFTHDTQHYHFTYRYTLALTQLNRTQWSLTGKHDRMVRINPFDLPSGSQSVTYDELKKVISKLPYELTHKDSCLVDLDGVNLLGFGYLKNQPGDTFVTLFESGHLKNTPYGKVWMLDEISPWISNELGETELLDNERLHLGHYLDIQPYFGVTAEQDNYNQMIIAKGYDVNTGISFFSKTNTGRTVAYSVDGVQLWTKRPNTTTLKMKGVEEGLYLTHYTDLDEDNLQIIGFNGIDRYSPTITVGSERNLVPLLYFLTPEELRLNHVLSLSDGFLSQLITEDCDHWTIFIGHQYGLPNIIYYDRLNEGVLSTTVKVFSIPESVLNRTDKRLGSLAVTTLTDKDKATIHDTRIVNHTPPNWLGDYRPLETEGNIYTRAFTLVKKGNLLTVSLTPNNHYGNKSRQFTLTTLTEVNLTNRTLESVTSDGLGYEQATACFDPVRGWRVTNFDIQKQLGGVVSNANVTGYVTDTNPAVGDPGTQYARWNHTSAKPWVINVTDTVYLLAGQRTLTLTPTVVNLEEFRPLDGTSTVFIKLKDDLDKAQLYVTTNPSQEEGSVLWLTVLLTSTGISSIQP